MQKKLNKSIKKYRNKGITLIALIITIIILLILAGISISSLTGSGLFGKASNATNKYNQAKARETLELVLEEALIQKYDEGLTEEQLDRKIQEIGELMKKENPNPNIQNVIVEGHIFKVDKSIPKIIDYVAPADGIIITAVLSNNATDGWLSADESDVNIKGKVITYSGGKITEISAKSGETPIEISVDKDGKYEINHITESSTITIQAKDNKGKENKKEIEVKVRIDKTAPTVETVKAEVEERKIKLSATGHDKNLNGEEQSGIKEFNYTITPADGVTNASGTFSKNETVEITVTNWTIYTIKVTAIDKCKNTTAEVNAKEQTADIRDTTPPELTGTALVGSKKITISASASDNQSGLERINYKVTPDTITPNSGTIANGEKIELTATEIREYTITFTATDNAGNTTNPGVITKATTEDGGVIKHIRIKDGTPNGTLMPVNTKKVYGTDVTGYTTTRTDVSWQLFYIDETKDSSGKVTDSQIYLISKNCAIPPTTNTELVEGSKEGAYNFTTDLLNKYKTTIPNTAFTQKFFKEFVGETISSTGALAGCNYMLDQNVWSEYVNSKTGSYAYGGPTLGLWAASFNDICTSDMVMSYKRNGLGYAIKIGESNYVNEIPQTYIDYVKTLTRMYRNITPSVGTYFLSPSEYKTPAHFVIWWNGGNITRGVWSRGDVGFRPVVSLRTTVQFIDNGNGTYTIY